MLLWGGGALLARVEWTQPAGPPISVALVQGAVPQSMKWKAGQLEHTMRLYTGLTAPHLGAQIIVWPESAIPALESSIREFIDSVRVAAAARGSSLIMGLVRKDPATGDYYNAIGAWSPAEQWYHKRRLVPFGEFFPVPARVREWMRLMNLPYSDFASGSAHQAPLQAAGQALAPTVCYEDAYGAEQLELERRSTLLVNVTNDAWFGDSTAPHQHVDISRMRSLESGRPMLRATNDGVTALIAAGRRDDREPAAVPAGCAHRFRRAAHGADTVPALRQPAGARAVPARPVAAGRGTSREGRMSEHRGAITREGERYPSPRRDLDYLDGEPPEPGHARQVGERLWWARIPLPMELNHINVWLIDEGDHWMLVDTGMAERGLPRRVGHARGAAPRRATAAPRVHHARPPGPHGTFALARVAPRRRGVDVRIRAPRRWPAISRRTPTRCASARTHSATATACRSRRKDRRRRPRAQGDNWFGRRAAARSRLRRTARCSRPAVAAGT